MECQGGAGYCLHSVHVLLLPVCQLRSDNDIASDSRVNVRSLHDINPLHTETLREHAASVKKTVAKHAVEAEQNAGPLVRW